MVRKDPDLKIPTNVTLIADYEELNAFKQMVGSQNFSKEIRAMIRDRVRLQKNERPPECDPLGLSTIMNNSRLESKSGRATITNSDNNSRQSTLFETFAKEDRRSDIVKFIQSQDSTDKLNIIETNCKAMLKVSETHRKRLVSLKVRV